MSKNVCFQHRFERAVRKRLAASGGGHTLRCHDLGMILAWRRSGVSDGGHSADVMKKSQGSDCGNWERSPHATSRKPRDVAHPAVLLIQNDLRWHAASRGSYRPNRDCRPSIEQILPPLIVRMPHQAHDVATGVEIEGARFAGGLHTGFVRKLVAFAAVAGMAAGDEVLPG